MSTIAEFSGLADDIQAAFNHAGRDHDLLGAISNEHLGRFMRETQFDAKAFLAWSISADNLPFQGWNFDFGEPAITVARNDILRIDILFWMQKAAPVHDHVTCGSFGAFMGDRLHTRYSFQSDSPDDADISVGTLDVHDFHYMREGEASEIQPDLIHDIYWLDTPSVTLVVRCNEHPGVTRRPADYLWPGIRIVDPLRLPDSLVKRRSEALELLARADTGVYVESLTRIFNAGTDSQKVNAFTSAAIEYPDALDAALERVDTNSPLMSRLLKGRDVLVRRSVFGGTYAGDDAEAQLLAGLLWASVPAKKLSNVLSNSTDSGEMRSTLERAYQALIEVGDLREELDAALGALGLLSEYR